ncbi:hypothetical protein D9M71_681940 [compost metagenome]
MGEGADVLRTELLDNRRKQALLAAKVAIDRALRSAGFRNKPVDTDPGVPLREEHVGRYFKNALTLCCLFGGRGFHVARVFLKSTLRSSP